MPSLFQANYTEIQSVSLKYTGMQKFLHLCILILCGNVKMRIQSIVDYVNANYDPSRFTICWQGKPASK